MFELLGTSAEHKRDVIYETGHFVPGDQLVKETLDWFGRHLGSVKDARKTLTTARAAVTADAVPTHGAAAMGT
jgi:hypothetical protein